MLGAGEADARGTERDGVLGLLGGPGVGAKETGFGMLGGLSNRARRRSADSADKN